MINIQKLKEKIIKLNRVMAVVLGVNVMILMGLIIAVYSFLTIIGFLFTIGTVVTPIGGFASIVVLIGLLICYGIYKPYTRKYTELLNEKQYKSIIKISIISLVIHISILVLLIIKTQQINFPFYITAFMPVIVIYTGLLPVRIYMVNKLAKLPENTEIGGENDEFTK